MGLLTKEVEIGLVPHNVNYYENLGYTIPRKINKKGKSVFSQGTKIKVKTEHLKNGSNEFVDVRCDCCNKIINNLIWQDYKKCVKDNGEYYCNKCANKLYGRETYRKTKLKNSKSFEQWCIENNKQDSLNRWDYELNGCKPSEITYGSKKNYWFKCLNKKHKSELKQINNFTKGQEGSISCNQCNSFAQWGIDNICADFLNKYWDWKKNTVDPWEISKGTDRKKIWIKCQEKDYHGSYNISCRDFIKGYRCFYCNIHSKVHSLDSLGALYPEVLEIWSNKNKKSPYEYSSMSHQNVWWKCENNKHEDYYRNICDSNNYDFRCPECSRERNESFLQEKVRLYLNELDYTVLHEHNCTLKCINPKTKHLLPYDNEIEELKLLIEVHGQQHYNIGNFHKIQAKERKTSPEYEFHMLKVRDRYKRIFAKKQGYFYLEIPYWRDDDKESWKKMIDDKISEIINGLDLEVINNV